MSIIVSTLRKSSSSSTSMLSGIVVHLLFYQCDLLFIKLMFVGGLAGCTAGLGEVSGLVWCRRSDLNTRHLGLQPSALPS